MGQARARRAAALAGTPWRVDASPGLPKDAIARAVREPLLLSEALRPWTASGSCAHQAEIGRRILAERFGVGATVLVGDLVRPMGRGRLHSYTRNDGSISVEDGAYHAWLHLDRDGSYVDLAAWELPARMERQGIAWMGPRPDYIWDRPERLSARGYVAMVDREATAAIVASLARGDDEGFLSIYLAEALAVLERCMAPDATRAWGLASDAEPHINRRRAEAGPA